MKAFIVEDSVEICERLCSMIDGIPGISLAGHADNEDAAVRDIGAIQPGLLILDLNLSGGSGMEVLRRIKSQGFSGTVIVLTNYAYPQYRKKSMELGADYFLDKSQEIERLNELLVSLANSQLAHQEDIANRG